MEWATFSGVGRKLVGNCWRTTGDINDTWGSNVGHRVRAGHRWRRMPGPGHWNDPDMLVVGRASVGANVASIFI